MLTLHLKLLKCKQQNSDLMLLFYKQQQSRQSQKKQHNHLQLQQYSIAFDKQDEMAFEEEQTSEPDQLEMSEDIIQS